MKKIRQDYWTSTEMENIDIPECFRIRAITKHTTQTCNTQHEAYNIQYPQI